MIAWNSKSFYAQTALPKLDAHTSGMIAGTKVATNLGWAPVETIRDGQQVLTFDGGLQTVVAITRHSLMADQSDVATWPLSVPAGALGNHENMTILPHQSMMIESDTAEDLTGDPFALIPAAALQGFHGISLTRPQEWVEVIQLHFAQDEIVFANIGALFLCRAQSGLLSDSAPTSYDVLPMDQAEDLVDCLALETRNAASPKDARRAVA